MLRRACAGVVALCALALAPSAFAATFTVGSNQDSGAGTLADLAEGMQEAVLWGDRVEVRDSECRLAGRFARQAEELADLQQPLLHYRRDLPVARGTDVE